ncbi:MAG: D-alanine--D-alanine ligase [Sedimentisphaerales bacterium]|nr:D-alanine--D-alanine ligase [Sedimentisphaerales bacterium]
MPELDTLKNKLKVAVLAGGIGAERQISLQSGGCVTDALKRAGFDVITADIRPDKLEILEDGDIDIFFPVLHGQFGEDGRLQQILEDKSLLYAGSGPAASKSAFDKMISKKLFAEADVTAPAAIEFDNRLEKTELKKQLLYLADKYVIKPIRQGSSVGINIASNPREAMKIAEETFHEFGDCMIEEFVPGREITVGILCGETLPIIEIRTKSSFYNFHAKYIDEQTEYLFDTIAEPAISARIDRAALDCFDALGCRHFARADFILSEDGTPYILEVNTIPGFTTHSLLPKAAARAKLSMSDLCKKIIETAYSSLVKYQA